MELMKQFEQERDIEKQARLNAGSNHEQERDIEKQARLNAGSNQVPYEATPRVVYGPPSW